MKNYEYTITIAIYRNIYIGHMVAISFTISFFIHNSQTGRENSKKWVSGIDIG